MNHLFMRFWGRNLKMPACRIMLFCLFLVMTNISALSLSIVRIQNTLTKQAAEFLGGDLKLSSPTPLSPEIRHLVQEKGLNSAETVEFLTMLSHEENRILSEIKGVDTHYPLIGTIQIFTSDPTQIKAVKQGPDVGKIWLEPRLLSLLHAHLGDRIKLGTKFLTIEYLLQAEPDKLNSGFFSPRAMVNQSDLSETGLIQAGSRVQYYLLLTGTEQQLKAFQTSVAPKLQATQTLIQAMKNKSIAQKILENTSLYVYFCGFINLLLAGITLYFSVKHYLHSQIPWVAFLKCTGISQKTLTKWYLSGFMLLGGSSLLLGALFGHWLSLWGLSLLGQYLPQLGETQAPWFIILLGFFSFNLLFLSFIFPFIRQLSQTPGIRVLHPQTVSPTFNVSYYVLGLGFLCLVPFLLIGSLKIVLMLIGGFLATLAVSILFLSGLLKIVSYLYPKMHPIYQYIFAQLMHRRTESMVQLLIFTLLLSIMGTLYTIKTELIAAWVSNLPQNTPNYFLINITEETRAPLETYAKNHHLTLNGIYPTVRGRLFQVNGKPLLDPEHYSDKRGLNRLWNLTFSDSLPPKNTILNGSWFSHAAVSHNAIAPTIQTEVSIEKDIAASLGLEIGDVLSFQVDEQIIEAKLSSIRSVSWQTFQPNFFAIFPASIENNFIKSYLTSIYIPNSDSTSLKSLSSTFPSIFIIDIKMLISQIAVLYEKVSALINGLFLYSLLFSLLIFFSIVRANAQESMRHYKILQVIGICPTTIERLRFGEYAILGVLSGLSAIIIMTISSHALLHQVFNLPYHFMPILIIIGIMFGPILGFLSKHPL